MRVSGSLVSAIICFIVLIPSATDAQTGSSASPVEEAERLRDAGDLAGAVRILERHVATQPGDVRAARLLAQSLYWMHELSRARTLYDEALRRHPDDVALRLEYARMLLETRDGPRLRAVLAPLQTTGRARADVHAILGTDAYWNGDYTTARRLLADAIGSGTTDPAARRQLDEIRSLTAAWIRLSPAVWHDDQPLDRVGLEVAGGWFLTPLVPFELRVAPDRYSSDGMSLTTVSVDGRISAYLPDSRLEIAGGGGFIQRSQPESARDWTALVSAHVRLPQGITAGGRLQRSAYFNTLSSLATAVTYRTLAAQLRVDTRGWLAEAEHRRQGFFDDNAVRTSYAWVLAPIVRRPAVTVQAGYAGATSTSAELRFVPADASAPPTGVPPLGVYAPYHTPINLTSHSLTAAAAFSSSRAAVVRISGSAALEASEDSPFVDVVDGRLEARLAPRDFSPWTVRASGDFSVNPSWTVTITGETGRSAFYQWTTASVRATHRFGLRGRGEQRR